VGFTVFAQLFIIRAYVNAWTALVGPLQTFQRGCWPLKIQMWDQIAYILSPCC